MKGIEIEDINVGSGDPAKRGDNVTVSIKYFLNRGDQLDISDEPLTFLLGRRRVIPGLDRGIEGMQVSGVRKLRISPHLAYSEHGLRDIIPPNALLFCEVTLLGIERPR